MLNRVDMLNLKAYLKEDELFTRLIVYNDNPLDFDKDEIKDDSKLLKEFDARVNFTPQSFQLQGKDEKIRLHVYKSYMMPKMDNPPLSKETIYISMFIPQRIQDLDLRSYDLEERLANLLMNFKLVGKISSLEYSSGFFTPLPSVSGYTQYNMIFDIKDGFVDYAEY